MKKILAAALIVTSAAAGPAVSAQDKDGDRLKEILGLYQTYRYFDLRDALSGMENDSSPELVFLRAVKASVLNRLDEAILGFFDYLRKGPARQPRLLAANAWIHLADAYRRAGQYRNAAGAYRLVIERFGSSLEASDRAGYENEAILWSSLAEVPPQTVEILGDSVLEMENRCFPVLIKDKIHYVMHDTGSSLSVLYDSAAEDLGLTTIDPGVRIQTATGNWIAGRLAVVPELRLGRAVVRNAVFFVLPDEFFSVGRVRPGVKCRGLIGMSILSALKEFIETRDGRLLIPAVPCPRIPGNMIFFGFTPVIEVRHRGERLSMCSDTGSAETFLYPAFFRRHRSAINARARLGEVTVGGVGGAFSMRCRVLREFVFRVAGQSVFLRKVAVHTEKSHTNSTLFDGILGLDVLARYSRMIFNFESMNFILE